MKPFIPFILLFFFSTAQAQNLLQNSGFESYAAGYSGYMTTGNGNATSLPGVWQLAFVGNNYPTCTGASCGTTQIDNSTAYSGNNSLQINITKHTNRNDIRLFQSIANPPSANNYVVTFYMKSDVSGYPLTVNVFKSTEAINSNGSGAPASPYQAFTTSTRWLQYKMYVDLSSWTTAERTNMRISIRPNTTTAVPSGTYPKVFWFDDISFKPVDSLNELKDMAIAVATDRMYLAIDSGYTTEANHLQSDINTLIATNLTYPIVPVKAVGFNPAPTQITAAANPFINALNNWAATYLTQTFTPFPKSTPGNFVFSNGYDARTLAETAENLHWLIVSPYSGYRYHPELFRRLLTILYATTEDYKYNGMEKATIPGTNVNTINDWFAAKKMSNVWRMCDTSFAAYIVPTFKQIVYDAADSMGKLFNAFAQSIDTYQYTNRDISYAEVLMNIGLMRNNSTWMNMSKRIVDTINLVARQPDGAYLYYQKQNETTNYHGGTNSSLSRIWAISGYQPAWDCVAKTAMFEIFSIEGNNNPEFNTAPTWHTQWNGSSGFSPEALISITQNKYLKARYNKIRLNAGYVDDMPSSVAFYDSSIPTASSLPDNYVCYDRNIQGFRGRYGNFSYTATTRNTAIPITQPGLQTIVGAMEGITNSNGKDSLDAALMCIHSKVHVRNSSGAQHNDWGYLLANNTTPKITVSKIASTVSVNGGLQYESSGPSGILTNWSSYQQWITLPDRIIGVVETYPTNNAATQAFEIDGRVRFTYGRAISTPKYLITEAAGSKYSYGRFKAIIHDHDYTTVTTDTAGVVLDDYRNAMEIIFRYNLSNGSTLYSYPATTKKYFIVEIRDSAAIGDATVTRDISTNGVKGLIVKLNGKSYASYRNDNATATSVSLANAQITGATNEVHFSRGDSLINLPQIITSPSFNIPANEQILLISTTSPSTDLGRGWLNYSELLTNSNGTILPLSLNAFNGVAENCAVKLSWQTSNEMNIQQYVVEKSLDGSNFSAIGNVVAKCNMAIGNTCDYQFIQALQAYTAYFRLKIVDIDGKYSYSQIIQLANNCNANTGIHISIMPNPVVSKTVKLLLSQPLAQDATVQIIDINGKMVHQQIVMRNTTTATIILPSHISAGQYIVKVLTANTTFNLAKMIVP